MYIINVNSVIDPSGNEHDFSPIIGKEYWEYVGESTYVNSYGLTIRNVTRTRRFASWGLFNAEGIRFGMEYGTLREAKAFVKITAMEVMNVYETTTVEDAEKILYDYWNSLRATERN